MKHLILGIALATVSTPGLASASQDLPRFSSFNYKGTPAVILGFGPNEVHYLESDQRPSAIGEGIEALFKAASKTKAATKNSFP